VAGRYSKLTQYICGIAALLQQMFAKTGTWLFLSGPEVFCWRRRLSHEWHRTGTLVSHLGREPTMCTHGQPYFRVSYYWLLSSWNFDFEELTQLFYTAVYVGNIALQPLWVTGFGKLLNPQPFWCISRCPFSIKISLIHLLLSTPSGIRLHTTRLVFDYTLSYSIYSLINMCWPCFLKYLLVH
jgi:hypothetical protein